MWNKDEMKGKVEHAVGHVKETVGVATNNDRLADEGRADQLEGDVKDGLGHARREARSNRHVDRRAAIHQDLESRLGGRRMACCNGGRNHSPVPY